MQDVVPTLFVLASLTIFPLLILVPPIAIFSHFVMQRTIKRIETLATVTTDIRATNYTIRVPIVGKDELEHIRERFYQSNKLRGGAGIGLTLVKD